MTIDQILVKLQNCKRDDGSFNNDGLTWLPAIEELLLQLKDISLDDFCLLQAGIEKIQVD